MEDWCKEFMCEVKCSRCGEMLPAAEFNRSSETRTGYQRRCRKCAKVYNAELKRRKKDGNLIYSLRVRTVKRTGRRVIRFRRILKETIVQQKLAL